jgi:hypothetical protein
MSYFNYSSACKDAAIVVSFKSPTILARSLQKHQEMRFKLTADCAGVERDNLRRFAGRESSEVSSQILLPILTGKMTLTAGRALVTYFVSL